MATKYLILIIVAVYVAVWFITAWALGHDEKDDHWKSLWWMVSMFWPFVWLMCLCAWIAWLFTKNDRDLR